MNRNHAVLASAVLALACFASQSHAAVIVGENFDSLALPPDRTLPDYGWTAHRSDNGGRIGTAAWSTSDATNSGGGRQNRIVLDAAAQTPSGRVFQFANTAVNYVNWIGSLSIDMADYDNLQISFYDRNGALPGTGLGFRAAVRIFDGVNTNWYASTLTGATAAGWTLESASLSASIWQQFTFTGTESTDSNTNFSVTNGTSALPEGVITAVGFYSQLTNNGTMRLDSFSFTGDFNPPPPEVPEPASLSILALGGLALLRRARKI